MKPTDQGIVMIRHYVPTDYIAVQKNLQEGDLFSVSHDTEARLREKITRKPDSILVAIIDGEAIGNLSIVEDGWIALLFRLAVRIKFRKQGIAKKLFQAAHDQLKEKGYDDMHLLVDNERQDLLSYYQSMGFEKDDVLLWMHKSL